MNMNPNTTTRPLGAVKAFLAEAGGASAMLAAQCPSDLPGLMAMGAMVTATSVFAGFSVGLEVHRVTHSHLAAGVAFALWGSVIFVVERLMLVKLHEHSAEVLKSGQPDHRWRMAAPRLLMICVLSFLFSNLFLQKLFVTSLTTELTKMAQETGEEATKQADAQFGPEITRLEAANTALAEQVKEKEKIRAEKYDAWIAEAEGTAGSGVKGLGLLSAQKKSELDRATEDLAATRAAVAPDQAKNNEDLKTVREKHRAAVQTVAAAARVTDDILVRNRALWRIIRRDSGALVFFLLLMVGLMALESTALTIELLSPSHEYIKLLASTKQVEAVQREAQQSVAEDEAVKSATTAKDRQAYLQRLQKSVWDKVTQALEHNQPPNLSGPLLEYGVAVEDYLRQAALHAVPPAPPVSDKMPADPARVVVRVIQPNTKQTASTQPDAGYQVNFNRPISQAHLVTLRDLEVALDGNNLGNGNTNGPFDLSKYKLMSEAGRLLQHNQPLFKQLNGGEVHLLP